MKILCLKFMLVTVLLVFQSATANSKAMTVFWVGPHVLSPKAHYLIRQTQSKLQNSNTKLLSAVPLDFSKSRVERYKENLRRMEQSDLMIADISSFRGVSLDGDTAFSMGYFYGLGKPVMGYSKDQKLFFERILSDMASRGFKIRISSDGRARDELGDALESFKMGDNLMLAGAIEMSYQILGQGKPKHRLLPTSFEAALELALTIISEPVRFDPCEMQDFPELPRAIPGRLKVILNGPDVFRMEAKLLGLGKNTRVDEFKDQYGHPLFTGVFPFDVSVTKTSDMSPYQLGTRIFLKDVGNMCASQLSLANLVPYRGPGMDVGTAFEMGFMAAQNKPVYGYSDASESYLKRVQDFYESKGQTLKLVMNRHLDPNGYIVEDTGFETTMVQGCLESYGFGLASTLEDGLERASRIHSNSGLQKLNILNK